MQKKRIMTVYSSIGKPQIRLATTATSFDDVANLLRDKMNIPEFNNLKGVFDNDDTKKHELRGLRLPEGDFTIYLTQDKTKNGARSKAEVEADIATIQEKIAKAKKAKKGTKDLVAELTQLTFELEALKDKKSAPKTDKKSKEVPKPIPQKKVADKPAKVKETYVLETDILEEEECIPRSEVERLLKIQGVQNMARTSRY